MHDRLQSPRPRPEIFNTVERTTFGIVAKPLTIWDRAFDNGALRKAVLLVLLALLWEGYARYLDDPLLFPTFSSTVDALFQSITNGVILKRAWSSLRSTRI